MTRPISAAALTDELIRLGHLRGASHTPSPLGAERPWFVSVVLGLAGAVAGAFVLAVIAMSSEPEMLTAMVLGGPLLLAAFGLYVAGRSNGLLDQVALALSIAGQISLTAAAADATQSVAATAALVAALQLILLFAMPNELAKLLAAFCGGCAWVLAIRYAWWGAANAESVRPAAELAPALAGWVIAWVPVLGAVHVLVEKEPAWMAHRLRQVARPALNGLLLSLCFGSWISELMAGQADWERKAQLATNWLGLWLVLGSAAALYAALYAFRLRNRALIGVAAIGALLHTVQFYYFFAMAVSLKSGIMIVAGGGALLAAGWLCWRREPSGTDLQ